MSRFLKCAISVIIAASLLVLSLCLPRVNHPGKHISEAKVGNDRFVTADGALLPVRSWLPESAPVKAVVVALHGFNDYSNFFASSGIFLSSHGIASYAYDQRGFGGAPGRGLWSGVAAYTDDLTSFVREIHKRHPGVPLYVLGESMGGAVAIVAMTEGNPPDVDGIILVAPAVWGRETMPWYQRWLLAVGAHTLPWMELTGKSLHIVPSDNTAMLRSLGRDPLVIKGTRIDTVYGLANLMDEALLRAGKLRLPTLVQYGKNDRIIPKEPVFMMLKKMSGKTRTAFYEHGYHMLLRDVHGEQPLADIAAWIADHNSLLPYGKNMWQ
jgi:alpha-beta hydrolase superfamily lysophospholipase